MPLYAGIDLHSNNSYVIVMKPNQEVIYDKRLPNDLAMIEKALEPYADELEGVVVESTYNWYWLVDGLKDAHYKIYLANPTAAAGYYGLKHSDDKTDARWLANWLRLGILPTGYIYPKEQRGLREILRKRSLLVRQRTMTILSLKGTVMRYRGIHISSNKLKQLSMEEFQDYFDDQDVKEAVTYQWKIFYALQKEISELEIYLNHRIYPKKSFKNLKTVPGIGTILAETILLETGSINRFEEAGNYASYCRCVDSKRISNGKKKGENNRKIGNKYLSWAYIEAANFAIRHSEPIQCYYQRKLRKANRVLALKAIAHKLARACYYILKDEVSFDIKKAFG